MNLPVMILLAGLTGLYCAGKNHIAAILEERGIPVLDVDKLGHTALEKEKAAVTERFGQDILAEGGMIDRRRLGEKVFGKPQELAALEAIVHPAANILTEAWIARQSAGLCVINAALLHRSSIFRRLRAVFIVRAPFFIRLFRARKRDKLSIGGFFERSFRQSKFNVHYLTGNDEKYIINNFLFFGLRRNLEKRLDRILDTMGICRILK